MFRKIARWYLFRWSTLGARASRHGSRVPAVRQMIRAGW